MRRRASAVLLVTMLCIGWLGEVDAVAQEADLPAETVLDQLEFPTNMAFAPDGRLFFTEKAGRVRIVSADGELLPSPFATFPVVSAAETGLLGIALHPRFPREPWVYLYLSELGSERNAVIRVRADGNRERPDSEEAVFAALSASAGYHNGGDLLFGPDGALYVAVGEIHDPARAQNPDDIGGKMLRLAPGGSPAPGNPFGPDSPVFTVGHRNSFGLCAGPDGGIWETENGPDVDDEVNRLVPGENYGWPEVTGAPGDPRFVDAVAVFPDTVALTGCAVWRGDLYVGAFVTGEVYRVGLDGSVETVATLGAGVTDLQVGPDGRLWVSTSESIVALGQSRGGSTRSATASPSESPGSSHSSAPPAPASGSSRRGSGWLTVVVGLVLAGGLAWRLLAGRRLRDSSRPRRSDDR